jgi:hypothetical protein
MTRFLERAMGSKSKDYCSTINLVDFGLQSSPKLELINWKTNTILMRQAV